MTDEKPKLEPSSTAALEGVLMEAERVDEMNCQMSGSCCVADECEDGSHYMKSG